MADTYSPLNEQDTRVLLDLHREFDDELSAVLDGARGRVAVLDFPRHDNAGDSLIWSGEMTAMKRLGLQPAYIADLGRYDPVAMKRAVGDGPILFHGGGNFGDIWPLFQDERDRVVRENPDRRIICLPQTIRFRSRARAQVTNDIFAGHGGVTVLARDRRSLQHAREVLPDVDVRYCIDAALGNEAFRPAAAPSSAIVALQRQDQESAGSFASNEAGVTLDDWGHEGVDRAAWAAARFPLAVYKRVPPAAKRAILPLVRQQYPRMVELNLRSAVRKLSRGRVVVTDRLHAHVLASLLGINHVVLENSYGKIRPIFEEYSGRFTTAHFASSAVEASEISERLLAENQAD
jgi:pyruvyl transferase EpsO